LADAGAQFSQQKTIWNSKLEAAARKEFFKLVIALICLLIFKFDAKINQFIHRFQII